MPFSGRMPQRSERMQHEEQAHMEDDDLRGRPLNLAQMVAYQDGAVVSRTLVDRKAGTTTMFAFARGQGLSEHTAPYDATVYIVDGEARVTISGNDIRVQAGEMIIMPAGQPHALHAISAFKMLLVMIRS
jgi:quercetin dioxygenase-like cupin family protein